MRVTFLAQLGYITIMILLLFTPGPRLGAAKVLAGFMADPGVRHGLGQLCAPGG